MYLRHLVKTEKRTPFYCGNIGNNMVTCSRKIISTKTSKGIKKLVTSMASLQAAAMSTKYSLELGYL